MAGSYKSTFLNSEKEAKQKDRIASIIARNKKHVKDSWEEEDIQEVIRELRGNR